jgi:hypothetical protein
MSAACRFCGKEFANAQAVRAHLKGCADYQARPGKSPAIAGSLRQRGGGAASLGNERSDGGWADGQDQSDPPFDPARQLAKRLSAERIRLQLREVEEAHAELDRRAQAKERERQQQVEQQALARRTAERDRENARRLADENRREKERRDTAESQQRARRRDILQEVKRRVMETWIAPIIGRPDLKARALQEIGRELGALAVDEVPMEELVLIAEAIRDRIYREPVQAERDARERADRRQGLLDHGCGYASRALRQVEGLSFSEKFSIEKRVRDDLAEIEGHETTGEIEDWVDEILEAEGLGWDEDDA